MARQFLDDEHGSQDQVPRVDLYERARTSIDEPELHDAIGFVGTLEVGQGVLGRDLEPVGVVEEIRGEFFRTGRRLDDGVWIPFSFIQSIGDGRVVLDIRSREVDEYAFASLPDSAPPNSAYGERIAF